MLDGNNVTDPILQIMQMKNIQNNMDGMTRYKVTLFDGELQHTFGILATQKNHLVENDELKIGSVIRLEEYAANVLSKDPPKVVVILLNFEILGEMDTTVSQAESAKPVQNENIEPNKPKMDAKKFFNKKEEDVKKPLSGSSNNPPGMFNGHKIFGISSLNPYQNKWSIKARVTNKSGIRTYSNARGEGKLFNIELLDHTGEIKMSGFNEQCDKFYDMLQIDKVYYFSKAQLKTANKQYSKLNCDYEMTMNNETVIELCEDDTDSMPQVQLNIVQLCNLAEKAANDIVDVLAIVKSAADCSTIVARATGKELIKREITLVDDSACSITCTLWGKQAEEFDASDNPVVLLKGAKVGDYNGKTIGVAMSTVFQINPDIPEAHKLRGWFDQGGCDSEVKELSNTGMGGGGGMTTSSNWETFDKLAANQLGTGDKPDYFSAKATVMYVKKDNAMYTACPGEGCNKKVIDQNDGTYRCEKCNKAYPDFKWRLMLQCNIADFSETCWPTCFETQAETMLGISAAELGNLKSENNPRYDEIFSDVIFKEFTFKLRAKMETYNDERRVKVMCVTAEPIDYVSSSRRLLSSIKKYAATC